MHVPQEAQACASLCRFLQQKRTSLYKVVPVDYYLLLSWHWELGGREGKRGSSKAVTATLAGAYSTVDRLKHPSSLTRSRPACRATAIFLDLDTIAKPTSLTELGWVLDSRSFFTVCLPIPGPTCQLNHAAKVPTLRRLIGPPARHSNPAGHSSRPCLAPLLHLVVVLRSTSS